jgi:hypothetical protein
MRVCVRRVFVGEFFCAEFCVRVVFGVATFVCGVLVL